MSDFALQVQEPQKTLTHADCIELVARYFDKRCGVVLPDFFSHNTEIADVIGWDYRYSYMVEVKVSRSDFLADKKKNFRMWPEKGMGNFRYYACPTGLIKPEEVPDKWGLLYINDKGGVRQRKEALYQDRNTEAEHHLLYYYARKANYSGVHRTILDYRVYPKDDVAPNLPNKEKE
jgi:hypothetical protein